MIIIGCDYHPGFQQIAFVDSETGELRERRLQHREETEKFHRDRAAQGIKVRVGMEASGHARWFEDCWASCSLNYGLAMLPRSRPSEYANRRRIGKTRSSFCDSC